MDQPSPASALQARLIEMGYPYIYAYQVARGIRRPSRTRAFRIFREIGVKLGSIADMTDEEIRTLERLEKRAA